MAILQYLADSRLEQGLTMPFGDLARYRPLEWLNFISTEIHKTLGALFNPNLPAECRGVPLALFERRCDWLAGALGAGSFLMGGALHHRRPLSVHRPQLDLSAWR